MTGEITGSKRVLSGAKPQSLEICKIGSQMFFGEEIVCSQSSEGMYRYTARVSSEEAILLEIDMLCFQTFPPEIKAKLTEDFQIKKEMRDTVLAASQNPGLRARTPKVSFLERLTNQSNVDYIKLVNQKSIGGIKKQLRKNAHENKGNG